MTSTSAVGESPMVSHNSQRDFLLQRLMDDTQRLRNNAEQRNCSSASSAKSSQRRRKGAPMKNGTGSSSSATAEDTDRTDSEEFEENTGKTENREEAGISFEGYRSNNSSRKMFSNGLQLFNNPLHQYAATLAAAHFMQAAVAGFPHSGHSTPAGPPLPVLVEQYPLLYRSLFPATSVSNGGSTPACSIFPNASLNLNDSAGKPSEPVKTSAPNTTEKRMARISLASPQHSQTTPSPRKRAPSKIKEEGKNHSPTPNSGAGTPKKARAIRRIQFDDEMCSPVSGMYIKDLDECLAAMPPQSPSSQGDADPHQLLDDSASWVEASEEAKAELAKIPNIIGDYICRLCKVRYADAFQLAKHRCPRIAHEEYRCPECDKVFSCPANLASHRRWHKPKDFVVPADHNRRAGQTEITRLYDQCSGEKADNPMEPMLVSNEDTPIDLSNNRQSNTFTNNGKGHHNEEYDMDEDENGSGKHTNGSETCQTAPVIVSTPADYECQTCGKRFDAHRCLRAHALMHTNFNKISKNDDVDSERENEEVQCLESACQLWFLSTDALEKHQRSAHPKFVCKFCQLSFPTSPALTRHINRYHPAPVGECRVILLPQSPPSRA